MKTKLNKILIAMLILTLSMGNVYPVLAQEVPPEETPPPAETTTTQDTTENTEINSDNNHWDDDDEDRDWDDDNDEENDDEDKDDEDDEDNDRAGDGDETPDEDNSVHDVPQAVESQSTGTGGQDDGGNVGDTTIDTGDANANAGVNNLANTNVSISGLCCGGSATVANTGNGSGSSNNSAVIIGSGTNTDQSNSATIVNNVSGESETGGNEADKNVGNTVINTGDASATGTIITGANTNIDGVALSEFNIVENYTGDIILDLAAGCIAGCDGFTGEVANVGNGSDSENNASLDTNSESNTNQTNDGTVINNLELEADSGNNSASYNTGGDSTITTRDAAVSANVMTFLNNNLAGNVVLGVVNIFGDLIGDIILPYSAFEAFACTTCGGNTSVVNSGNGSGSENNAGSIQTSDNNLVQINNADIDNNLYFDAETGNNETSKNTGGNSSIETGNASVLAQVLNIANTNIVGGDWWLVIVNRAGQWIGQIVGAPLGSNFSGSAGFELAVGEDGGINVGNKNNGADSTNTASAQTSSENNTTQVNNAHVVNNLDLSANTGWNEASYNTGGNSTIKTGDAEAIASLINFVNNNIVGGRLLVTFVNVFGSWVGDFIAPGQQKIATGQTSNAQGGTGLPSPGNSSNSSSNSTNSNGNSQGSGGTQAPSIIAAAGTFGQNNFTPSPSANNTNTQIAGLSFTNPLAITGSENDKKTIHLNLAWFLFLIPLFLLPIAYKLVKKIINVINSARESRGYV